MKICKNCSAEKQLTDFYKNIKMVDGRLNKCKSCVLEDRKAYRLKNIETIKAYDRRRSKEAERLASHRIWAAKSRTKRAEKGIKWGATCPIKHRARAKLWKAVFLGQLQREPCEKCGNLEVDGHHFDYSKPLEVQWLCKRHHGEAHRKYNDVELAK